MDVFAKREKFMFTRHPLNPLITPQQVRSSRPDYEVIGAFNAGATLFGDETLLLLRVAERPLERDADWILCPALNAAGDVTLLRVRRDDPAYDTQDPRFVRHRQTGMIHLTSLSHLRLARSSDGVRFTVDEQPWLTAQPPYETYGTEDARITRLGDRYFINYTAVSPHGIATAFLSTPDFVTLERHGLLLPPSNRDVAVFPQKSTVFIPAITAPCRILGI
ncbi:MAG: hypothetical protein HC794_02955 [Nitrospiraceae bacterium]|nr:hypothetical protein [Nitrospiraceae bacterium]